VAYLNFSEPYTGPSAPTLAHDAIPEAPAAAEGFTATEWMVIGLAERDGLSSLATPGRFARALGGLFGLGASSRLADARLERLRRFAVLVRKHGWRVSAAEVTAFLEDFSVAQLETVIASATRRSMLPATQIPA
jgi:hypothetical protein